jgi:hypothetical protein
MDRFREPAFRSRKLGRGGARGRARRRRRRRARRAASAAGDEEVEVAAFVGLQHRAVEERRVAALGNGRRAARPARRERLFPARELGVVDEEIDAPGGDIEANRIAVLHQRERAAERGLGRDVQDDRAERGAAHARVGDAHHVLDALLRELLRDRKVAGLGHSRCPPWAGVGQHEDVVG